MNKAKLLLVLAFIVVCAAGAVVGTAVDRRVRPVAVEDPLHLGLTPDQSAAMKAIWEPVGELRQKVFGERRQLDHERHDEFEKLLTPEQLSLYKKIQQDYEAKSKALDDQFRQVLHDADVKSRALLTPDQVARYNEIRAKMGSHGMGPPPGFGPPHMHHGDHDHPHPGTTTAPATAPSGGSI
jgi:hypothetical protein